jgi:hypothetical protein
MHILPHLIAVIRHSRRPEPCTPRREILLSNVQIDAQARPNCAVRLENSRFFEKAHKFSARSPFF